jgi:cob(I)alamin adenosyltransferase
MLCAKKGYVHIYTGNGKGKTTAALGLALRAAGAGRNVFIAQFAKGSVTSELLSLKKHSRRITIRQFGRCSFLKKKPDRRDRAMAIKGIATVRQVISKGRCDMIILDELCVACHFHLVTIKEALVLIQEGKEKAEVVITGRNAPKELVKIADLVTEMKEIKHYFSKGIKARRGIEC